MTEEKARHACINLLVASQIIIESLDALRDYPDVYRGSLKVAARNLNGQIRKHIGKDIDNAFRTDDETCNDIIRGMESVSKVIATMNPRLISSLHEGITKFKENEHNTGN